MAKKKAAVRKAASTKDAAIAKDAAARTKDSAGTSQDVILRLPPERLFATELEALSAADSECDVVFLIGSPDPYDVDHVDLHNCQKLIGQPGAVWRRMCALECRRLRREPARSG